MRRQLLLCVYLSGAVFMGLILNSLFGWWFWDTVAALCRRQPWPFARESEVWTGDVESPFEVLDRDDRSSRAGRRPRP